MLAKRGERVTRSWRKWVLLGVGGVVAIWVLVSAVMLWQARRSVDAGIDRLEQARDLLSPSDLVRGEGRGVLEDAERDFTRARDLAGSPVLAPFGLVPVVGQQVRSIDAQTEAAAEVVDVGLGAMTGAEEAFRVAPAPGPERVALMEEVARIATRAEERLGGVDLGPDFFLVGPIGDARAEFAGRLVEIRASLADSRTAASGLADFLRGPGRYVVLAANNAEMRAGTGMWLSAGALTVEGGRYDLGELVPSGDLVLPAGAVPVGGDLAARWGFFSPTRDFRNLAVSPRFDETAPLAADMWTAATGEPVDGVLAVDPLALRAILAAEGPVDVPEVGTLDAENVLPYLFLDQYRASDVTDPDQQARRDRLGSVARLTLDALEERPWEPPDLVDELAPAGAGRHLLAWSRDPVEQRGWEAARIGGTLDADSLLVSLMNIGGNKLDQFVPIVGEIRTSRRAGGWEVAVALTVRNDAPTGEPAYVVGPHPRSGVGEGVYLGILALNVPGAATDVRLEGGGDRVASGPDGETQVVATRLELARGEERDLTVRFVVPDRSLVVEPSARHPGIEWRSGDREWVDGDGRERLEW